MNEKQVNQLLERMGIRQVLSVTQFLNQEDGEPYDVWRIDTPDAPYVLKRANAFERETYEGFFSEPTSYAPQLIAASELEGEMYLLLEYIRGQDLMRCGRASLTRCLDSLIAMQDRWWGNTEKAEIGQNFEQSLEGRRNRLSYLKNPVLEKAYLAYLDAYCTVARTLCHDDLLPFNVMIDDDRAVFIDWEYGGILPYPTSLARLIAHGEESADAFFYMTEADKQFAIDYYFEKFIKNKGISRQSYQNTMDLFLFYEYCEWIYVGHKYEDTDNDRFRKYYRLALKQAEKMGYS